MRFTKQIHTQNTHNKDTRAPMRALFKSVAAIWALWFALRLACRQELCASDGSFAAAAAASHWDQICFYTSLETWNGKLSESSATYRDVVLPQVREQCSRVSSYYRREARGRYVEPVVEFASDKWVHIGGPSHVNHCRQWASQASDRVQYYVQGVVRPFVVARIVEPLHLGSWLSYFQFYFNKTLGSTRNSLVYVKREYYSYVQKLQDRMSTAFETTFVVVSRETENVGVTPTSILSSASSSAASIASDIGNTETIHSADEEEEIETTTSTSTLFKTVTIHSNNTVSSTADIQKNDEPKENDIEEINKEIIINEQDVLQNEFDEWSDSIDKKVSSINKIFDKEVLKSMNRLMNATQLELKQPLIDYSNSMETYFRNITQAIRDIDCKEERDPQTGEKLYFNKKTSTQLERYIDREFVRELFNGINVATDTVTKTVQTKLNTLMDDINSRVDYLRSDYADLYEEWGNVMVNEWSKRLVYADVVGGSGARGADRKAHFHAEEAGTEEEEEEEEHDNDDSSDSQSEVNWKRYLKIKKRIISARDELIEHEVDLKPIEKFIKKVENVLKALLQDNGEFTYILRSKANLAFQQREKEAADKKAREEAERRQAIESAAAEKSAAQASRASQEAEASKRAAISSAAETQEPEETQAMDDIAPEDIEVDDESAGQAIEEEINNSTE